MSEDKTEETKKYRPEILWLGKAEGQQPEIIFVKYVEFCDRYMSEDGRRYTVKDSNREGKVDLFEEDNSGSSLKCCFVEGGGALFFNPLFRTEEAVLRWYIGEMEDVCEKANGNLEHAQKILRERG